MKFSRGGGRCHMIQMLFSCRGIRDEALKSLDFTTFCKKRK